MTDGTKTRVAPKPLTAIKIDPEACRVDIIQVEPDEVAGVLRSKLTDTVDFEEGNCLVIDDGNPTADHPSRFHFDDAALQRPYFGTALILGLANSNWASTSMEVEGIRTRVIWEHWDRQLRCYAEPVLEKA